MKAYPHPVWWLWLMQPAALVFALICGTNFSRASDGDVDLAFGNRGAVTLDFMATSMGLQPDGQIVIAGFKPGLSSDLIVARYNSNGSRDLAFGIQGIAQTGIIGNGETIPMAVQRDGKIVVAGSMRNISNRQFSSVLVRLNPDGFFDPTFGSDGKSILESMGTSGRASAIAIQPDGKIIVAGTITGDFAVARYNRDGSVDTSFGIQGKATTDFSGGDETANALALASDGKIVLAGATNRSGSIGPAIARYNADGSPDSTFGIGGKVLPPPDYWPSAAYAIAVQPDKKIVVAGGGVFVESGIRLMRLNPDGSMDATFRAPPPPTTPDAKSLALQSDGKIIIGTNPYVGYVSVARYNTDGSIDTTFGTAGGVLGDEGANAVAIQSDGKIVAVARRMARFENPSGIDSQIAPTVTVQPVAQTIARGSTVVFTVTALGAAPLTYQWIKDGVPLAGATNSRFVLPLASAEQAGNYRVEVANHVGRATSTDATLDVITAAESGHLNNVSVLTALNAGESLIMGIVLGGVGTSGTKPLLIRAAGPALTQFGVKGVLSNPTLTLRDVSAARNVVIASNNGWGGAGGLANAFAQLGAFAFPEPASKDAAIFQSGASSLAAGNYAVQVSDANNGSGVVLAELYDATPAGSVTSATPRLINVSVLKQIGPDSSLTAGFTISGATARTVLVRAIGPSLRFAPFNISGAMAAPGLVLSATGTGALVASNAGWGGDPQIAQAANRVGAFALPDASSKDSTLLTTLAPGKYVVEVTPTSGTPGTMILEIYEVP
jgi:uncharacterized delta-60 repeat protein